jgi:hypothetical protein
MEQLRQFSEHLGGLLADVLVGVATELVAPPSRRPFAFAVLFPCVTGMVEAVAVELDGEAVVRPPAVDVVAFSFAIRDRQGQLFFG